MFLVLLAVAVPTIGPFIGLIGAFCFSLLGLIIPIFIEIVTYWDLGFGACNWIILKNILVFGFGVLALIFGTYTSIEEIAAMYSPVVDEARDLFNKTAVNATEVFGQLASTVVSSVNVTDTIDKLQSAVGNNTAMAAVLDAFSNGTKTVAEAVLNAGNGTNPLS